MPGTSLTETYDAVLTTTLRNMQPTLRDNITRSNKLLAYLEMRGRMRTITGGERIKVTLMYGLNNGADIYQGYGNLSVQPQDGITSAFFPWAQLSVPITISGLEADIQNVGDSAVMDLLTAKITQSENSGKQLLNNCIVMGRLSSGATGNRNQFVSRTGKMDNSAAGPLPLPALVDANASRSVAIGSINGANEAWWRNQVVAFSGSTFAAYKSLKNRLYNTCARGTMGNPDLILSDQYVWELYMNSLSSQERYIVTDPRVIDVLGGIGEDMLKFRGAIHIWDEMVPDVGTTTATQETESGLGDSVGTPLATGANGTEFHLNSRAMEYVVASRRNWTQTPFVRPENQDARVAQLLWAGQVCLNNRRKHGVMYDIDNSIAA